MTVRPKIIFFTKWFASELVFIPGFGATAYVSTPRGKFYDFHYRCIQLSLSFMGLYLWLTVPLWADPLPVEEK